MYFYLAKKQKQTNKKIHILLLEEVHVSPEKNWLSGLQLFSNLHEQLRLEQSIS